MFSSLILTDSWIGDPSFWRRRRRSGRREEGGERESENRIDPHRLVARRIREGRSTYDVLSIGSGGESLHLGRNVHHLERCCWCWRRVSSSWAEMEKVREEREGEGVESPD